jgi:rifampin ADP-ribosylating transferase
MQRGYFHGTKADLKTGDLLSAGYASNFGSEKANPWIYLAGTLEAAIWGAELALGEARERIYVVEATGEIVDDPNLTDKKFPGNPTQSYRSRDPLRIVGEVVGWQGHPAEQLETMKAFVAKTKAEGVEAID